MTEDADKNKNSLLSAMHAAQRLAFGPLLFQAARVLKKRGILTLLRKHSPEGLSAARVAERSGTSMYGATVLLEAAMASELVRKEGDEFFITKVGLLIDKDKMTEVNMNFVHDVCYQPGFHLEEAISEGTPAGLKELGPWPTVYEGLKELGEPARTSWLEFDHFYSDDSFPQILRDVFSSRPRRILDVGGNTGKFALAVLRHDQDVRVTVADLPGQIASCRRNLEEAGLIERANFHEFSILAKDAELPSGFDVIWMSQFLSCFSEAEVVHNLSVAKSAMGEHTRLLIMDNLWDRQKNEVAQTCLQATSLYFTVVANGTSRMYDGKTLVRLIGQAGLTVTSERDKIGWGHSIIECRRV
jgi:hypothetical protein